MHFFKKNTVFDETHDKNGHSHYTVNKICTLLGSNYKRMYTTYKIDFISLYLLE